MGALGQISFFVALILVIVIHEAAHFGVARLFGMKVTEFFVGFGPRIWSRTTRTGTEVGFKWIPAGGYVKIAGMNPYEEVTPEDLPNTYGAKPRWQRALVIFAGPATHFVLAFVCFALWLGLVGQPTGRSPEFTFVAPRLDGATSPAAAAGLRAGDRVVAVEGVEDPTNERLVEITQKHVGSPMTLVIERDDRTFEVEVVPVLSAVAGEQIGRIGVGLGEGRRETTGILTAVTRGTDLVGESIVDTAGSLGRVFGPEGIGRIAELVFTDAPRDVTRDPASIVGVGRLAGSIASDPAGNAWDILYLFAVVNVFVGFLNLLPLPPFDGGHLAVLVIERIRGKAVDMRKVIPVSAAVAAFFIVFTVAVVYVDIVKPPV